MPEPPLPPDNGQLLPDRDSLELRLLPVNVPKMPTIRRLLLLDELPNWPDSELLLQGGLPLQDRDNKRQWQQRKQLLQEGLPPQRKGNK